MNNVCVTIPVYKRFSDLDKNEIVSWNRCIEVLSKYKIILVCSRKFDTSDYISDMEHKQASYAVKKFNSKFFDSIDSYNQLMLSKSFYKSFLKYDYILTYQLDAYIFVDQLEYWMSLDYSYIGAPWFYNFSPENGKELWKVGNGGFTLRKITSCMRVLNTFALVEPYSQIVHWYLRNGRKEAIKNSFQLFRRLILGNNTYWLLNDYYRLRAKFQEDYFWGVICSEKFDWYKVPNPEQALKFSFEVSPSSMYRLNNFELPMGCHAWDVYDPEFWKEFIPTNGIA